MHGDGPTGPEGPGEPQDEDQQGSYAAAGGPLFPEVIQAETALATLPAWRAWARLLARREQDALDLAVADALDAATELQIGLVPVLRRRAVPRCQTHAVASAQRLKMSAEAWSAIGTGVAGVAALASAYVAWRAIKVARDVADMQVKLSQRQLLLPLWEYMASLRNVDPSNPVVPDVLKVVNTLELVALCVEGEMVDGQIIRRTFRDGFIAHFDQVKACGTLKNMNGKTGMDLLRENRAALSLYERLMEEHRKQDEAAPLKARSK